MYISPGSASRIAFPVASASWIYSSTFAVGFQNPPLGSFHISHSTPRPLKCLTAAAAHLANAARPSSVCGDKPSSYSRFP